MHRNNLKTARMARLEPLSKAGIGHPSNTSRFAKPGVESVAPRATGARLGCRRERVAGASEVVK